MLEKFEKLEKLRSTLKKYGYAHVFTKKYHILIEKLENLYGITIVTVRNFPIGSGYIEKNWEKLMNHLSYFGKILEVKV